MSYLLFILPIVALRTIFSIALSVFSEIATSVLPFSQASDNA